jgi:hypothetical protein
MKKREIKPTMKELFSLMGQNKDLDGRILNLLGYEGHKCKAEYFDDCILLRRAK